MFNKDSHASEADIFVNLTPLIDILTCLLFFLLLGYKSQSVMLEAAKDMALPISSSEKGLAVTLTVAVSLNSLKLQDSHVMFLRKGSLPENDVSGSKIVPLYNRLQRILQIQRTDPKNAIVFLLADKRLDTDVITKVMKTCGMAGIPNFHLGVAKP